VKLLLKMLLALACCWLPLVWGGATCLTGPFPPTNASSDPYPAEGSAFGKAEGGIRPLADDEAVCKAYKARLAQQATDVRERHASTVFIDDNNCLVIKYKSKAARSTTKHELYYSKVLSGREHFMRYVLFFVSFIW
jgi:hypothetical protein